jgi:hypothetical protein
MEFTADKIIQFVVGDNRHEIAFPDFGLSATKLTPPLK